MKTIKLLIVEDDPAWIKLLQMLFNIHQDIEVVAAVDNIEELHRVIEHQKIDIILMDINLTSNRLDGVFIAAEISQKTTAKIIMLSSLNPKEVAVDSFNAGAIEFISKSQYQTLPLVIKSAMKSNTAREELLKDYQRLKQQEVLGELSSAEKEILDLLMAGHTRCTIKKKLLKSDSTIKNQINNILRKLDVGSTKDAIKKIKLRGLYDPMYIEDRSSNE